MPPANTPFAGQDADVPAYFFVHIYKTAGTSINHMLDGLFPREQVCPAARWRELVPLPPDSLSRYRLFRGHFAGPLNQYLGRELVEFTLLRDPVARAISQFRQIVRGKKDFQKSRFAALGTLGACLRDPELRVRFINIQARFLTATEAPCGRPSIVNLDLGEAELLAAAKQRLDRMACVGTTESFDSFIKLLSDTFDWDPPNRSLRLNTSTEREPRAELTQDDLDILRELNRVDMELHAYAGGLMAKQLAAQEEDRRKNPEAWLQRSERRIQRLTARVIQQDAELMAKQRALNSFGANCGTIAQRMMDRVFPHDSMRGRLARAIGRKVGGTGGSDARAPEMT